MKIRDLVKKEARRLNGKTVALANLLEENFEDVVVAIDVLNETDVNGNDILVQGSDGEMMYRTDIDFIVIESGSFFPSTTATKCTYVEQTEVTFVSTNREDIIEDVLTIIESAKSCGFILQSSDKLIQPLGDTGTQLTAVTATFTRPTKVG